MKPFPVLDSILSPDHLAVFVKEKYGLGVNTACRVLRTGINHSYLIVDQEAKHVLRVYSYQWRTKKAIAEELRMLNLLKQNGVSVSYPIKDREGEFIQKIEAPEGLRYAVIFSYAKGDKVRNLSETQCNTIGNWMARMHQVSYHETVDRITYNAETLTQLPYQEAKARFPESMEEMQFVKKAGSYLTAAFCQLDSSELRTGAVHLDLWYDNMNIDAEEGLTVFDFDFCGNGWLLLDIAYCVMQLFHTEPERTRFEAKADAFFKGYEGITPISKAEKDLIPMAGVAIWIFYLGVQNQRFNNWSNIFLSPNYLKHYIGMIQSWMTYHELEMDEVRTR